MLVRMVKSQAGCKIVIVVIVYNGYFLLHTSHYVGAIINVNIFFFGSIEIKVFSVFYCLLSYPKVVDIQLFKFLKHLY